MGMKVTVGDILTFWRKKGNNPAKLSKNDLPKFQGEIRENPKIQGNF